MAPIVLAPCSLADSEALSRNNMSAFWTDANWVISWRNTTLEEHIASTTLRYPRRLISDHEISRHQKAIDPETGRLLGYARWLLPASNARNADGELVWPEALGPAVGPEEEAEIRRVAAAAPWNPINDSDPLDSKIKEVKERLLQKKPYMYYLAVHPENQGKGVGSLLIQSGMKQAEKLGLDIFIVAFRGGWGVYSRHGFRVEEELIQDDSIYGGPGEYAMRFMIYDQPQKSEV
ncbi:acyl- n-acyltransferase [Trichoderma arundinaceum]|uniref:Acyl-n-acyltransferase n=1 Tax=Trichoderma arundinaceum TaxID=490622 RepID=A0A395NRF6_TRIAR|nr:acyl- n-acyltransferase [Trichoderma arundinaceum]